VWQCGGCVVPIPVELKSQEKQEILRTIALRFVITEKSSGSFVDLFHAGRESDLGQHFSVVPIAGGSNHPAGFHRINSAFIRFTSGTTGAAKGVVLSHQTIADRIAAANEVIQIGPEDRVTWLLSMAYHFAVSIAGYLSCGAAIILMPNHFAAATLEASRRYRATVMYGSPLHYAWMASHEQAVPLPSLRLAVSTTTALDVATALHFRQRFGLPLTQALGIIEIGLPFINVDFPDRHEAVGRLVPAYRMRLDDVGLGPRLGEVLLSGPGFLDAYYSPWQVRAEIMPDGWFRTGDIGEIEPDGCLFLRGRSKDVIDVQGMKFFPQEVEAVLAGHPQVAGACVYGSRHERLGELPQARIVLKPGALPPTQEELANYCRRRLAEFKVPLSFEVVQSLERTASGKIMHRTAGIVEVPG
jgi:long-chain acyl-CoA synthetase